MIMKTNKHISLDDVGKELPFAVPEHYFEQFPLEMERKIAGKKKSVHKLLKPWMYLAAMFVGILIIGQIYYMVYQHNTSTKQENYESYVLSQVDESSLMDYYVEDSSNQKK